MLLLFKIRIQLTLRSDKKSKGVIKFNVNFLCSKYVKINLQCVLCTTVLYYHLNGPMMFLAHVMIILIISMTIIIYV